MVIYKYPKTLPTPIPRSSQFQTICNLLAIALSFPSYTWIIKYAKTKITNLFHLYIKHQTPTNIPNIQVRILHTPTINPNKRKYHTKTYIIYTLQTSNNKCIYISSLQSTLARISCMVSPEAVFCDLPGVKSKKYKCLSYRCSQDLVLLCPINIQCLCL